jgi:hypothetical protein
MPRQSAALALLLALALAPTFPAAAATPFACRIGRQADDGFLLAVRFEMKALPESGRTDYRLVVRNPHAQAAAVLTGIALHGLVESTAEPVVVPPGGEAAILIGWFPHDMSAGRRSPPMIEEVRAAMTIPFCEVLAPEPGDVAMPRAGQAGAARRG